MTEYEEVIAIIGKDAFNMLIMSDVMPDELYEKLFVEYYVDCEEMPYGTKKARTGDPYQWMYDRLHSLMMPGVISERSTV